MRTGWEVDQQGLTTGLAKIVTPGPTTEIYTCYHSGRLVHAAADADTWADWRASVADLLIEAQTNDGDDAGSWPLRGRIQGHPLMYSEFGGPLLSWRVAILPFIDQQDLYAKLRLDESWNSPHNSKLLERMPALFASPGKPAGKRGETRYVAPVGPGTIFAARATPWPCDAVSMNDSTAVTILLVEAAADKAVPWTKQADLAIDERDLEPTR